MKATIAPSGILKGSGHKFTSYQVEMADMIFKLILAGDFKELGKLVNTIKTKIDYEYIHYVFYDKYEFGWLAAVQKYLSYNECVKYGFYNYNF